MAAQLMQFNGVETALFVVWLIVILWPLYYSFRHKTSFALSMTVGLLLGYLVQVIWSLFYNYYLRDMSIASIHLPLGLFLTIFGSYHGLTNWMKYSDQDINTPVGTVMISIFSIIMGLQFILAFLQYDISSIPKKSRD